MQLLLLGAPGSGKGTQAKLLVDQYKIVQISTGDLLRAAVVAGTALGKKAKAIMDEGKLVSDEIVLGLIRERIAAPDTQNGFILDGFPRNLAQAQALDRLLAETSKPLQHAIHIDVEFDALVKRITGRRSCNHCGAIYNIYFSPPKTEGVCDQCGARDLGQRDDDNEETVKKRLKVYQEQTAPLIDFYRKKKLLQTVKGEGEIEAIFASVCLTIDQVGKMFH